MLQRHTVSTSRPDCIVDLLGNQDLDAQIWQVPIREATGGAGDKYRLSLWKGGHQAHDSRLTAMTT